MKKAIFILVIALSLAVTAMPASASRWEKGAGAGYGFDRNIAAVPGLNLTDAQSAKIAALKTSFLGDIKPLRDKLFSKRGEAKLLWRDKNPDQKKIVAAQKEIRALRGQIQDRATAYRLAVRKVLTDEQRDKLKAFRQDKGFASARQRGRFAKVLGLSPEQKEKMKELRSRYKDETRDLRYDLAAKRLEMRKLFTDPKSEEAALLAKQKELNALRQQMTEKRSQQKMEWRKILTPEQIAKLDRIPHRQFDGKRGSGRHHLFGA
jgi:Spy/CpxP family protein refolding chaperone